VPSQNTTSVKIAMLRAISNPVELKKSWNDPNADDDVAALDPLTVRRIPAGAAKKH
jgi:hypothetical protein